MVMVSAVVVLTKMISTLMVSAVVVLAVFPATRLEAVPQ